MTTENKTKHNCKTSSTTLGQKNLAGILSTRADYLGADATLGCGAPCPLPFSFLFATAGATPCPLPFPLACPYLCRCPCPLVNPPPQKKEKASKYLPHPPTSGRNDGQQTILESEDTIGFVIQTTSDGENSNNHFAIVVTQSPYA